jgi:hypothetical protein
MLIYLLSGDETAVLVAIIIAGVTGSSPVIADGTQI